MFRVFKTRDSIQYYPLCDDFGPMNMACVVRFIEQLDEELTKYPSSRLFFCVEDGKRNLTNAVFLLGSYMILRLDWQLNDVAECFSWMEPGQYEEYRDATFCKPTFGLTLMDCWRGLEKGVHLGWVSCPDDDSDFWGRIDIDEYEHYDNPLNGDLHEVVPGKLIAFRGPQDLGAAEYLDDDRGHRKFSPSFYADVLKDFGVTTVVRLNEEEYDGRVFAAHGLRFVDLHFADCTAPPPHIIAGFFAAVDTADGAVAVHCKAGLGRTGTLIALYMMRSRGFTARDAMGWLRIMRPGSVIGEQQQFLCDNEHFRDAVLPPAPPPSLPAAAAATGKLSADLPSPPATAVADVGRAAAAAQAAAEVAAGMARRGAARAVACRKPEDGRGN